MATTGKMELHQDNKDDIVALFHRESRYEHHYNDQLNTRMIGAESPTSTLHHDNLLTTSTVASKRREKICQWMYRVTDFYNYDRKITYTA